MNLRFQQQPYAIISRQDKPTALKKGFSLEEAIAVLEGELADNKLNEVMLLAKSIVENRSNPKMNYCKPFIVLVTTKPLWLN